VDVVLFHFPKWHRPVVSSHVASTIKLHSPLTLSHPADHRLHFPLRPIKGTESFSVRPRAHLWPRLLSSTPEPSPPSSSTRRHRPSLSPHITTGKDPFASSPSPCNRSDELSPEALVHRTPNAAALQCHRTTTSSPPRLC
jgi:hypothetical protein